MITEQPGTLLNGEPVSTIPVIDRGLQFGDGVFETIRIYSGEPVWWQEHLDRLMAGCRQLRFERLPDADLILKEVLELSANQKTGTLKIIITRGLSNSGYGIPADISPNRILMITPGLRHSDKADQGIDLGLCQQRIAGPSQLSGIKHLNRLEQVMARIECSENHWDEGVMLDHGEKVIEGSMSNLFAWYHDKLLTPVLAQIGVKGITRDKIFRIARRSGINVEECELDVNDLLESDGLFVCNSLIGIWPVRHFLDRYYEINTNTLMLQQYLQEAMCLPD